MVRKEMKESNKTITKEEKTTSEQPEGEWILLKIEAMPWRTAQGNSINAKENKKSLKVIYIRYGRQRPKYP